MAQVITVGGVPVTSLSASHARALDDENLILAQFSLYRQIRRTPPDDPRRGHLLGAWELMDAENIKRGRSLPRITLHS
jgi:hypothetical protein